MKIFQKVEIDIENARKYMMLVDDAGEEIFNEEEQKWLVLFYCAIEQEDFRQAKWMAEHCPESLKDADIIHKIKGVLLSGDQLYDEKMHRLL